MRWWSRKLIKMEPDEITPETGALVRLGRDAKTGQFNGTFNGPGAGAILPGIRARKKKIMQWAEALKDEIQGLCSDPMELLFYVLITGKDPLAKFQQAEIDRHLAQAGLEHPFKEEKRTWIDKSTGEVVHVREFVDLEKRIEVARILMPYIYPRMAAMEVTGEDGKPVFDRASTDAILELGKDPEMRRLLEALAERAARAEVQRGNFV